MKQSIHNQVLNKVIKNKRGKLFFPTDFSSIGNVDAIKTSLSRLEKDGVLERLAKGIYLYPKKDPILGNLYPSTEDIADNIAKRDKAKIVPTGAAALNKLGLSTQVPMNVTYLTDGAPRKIKIGKQQITFKSTTAKRLSTKGKITTLAIHALQEIGQKNLNKQVLADLKPLLKTESTKDLVHDIKLAPVWIAEILLQLTEDKDD